MAIQFLTIFCLSVESVRLNFLDLSSLYECVSVQVLLQVVCVSSAITYICVCLCYIVALFLSGWTVPW